MDANPSDERPRSVMFLAAQKMGGYPPFVPQRLIAWRRRRATRNRPCSFEDIAARMGLDKTSGGRGTAIFDYDNDGWLDIAIASAYGGSTLYHNNGDGTSRDVSISSRLDTTTNTFAIAAGDYNNDGFTDLYITRAGFYVGEGQLVRITETERSPM
jgi:hypothetical protein